MNRYDTIELINEHRDALGYKSMANPAEFSTEQLTAMLENIEECAQYGADYWARPQYAHHMRHRWCVCPHSGKGRRPVTGARQRRNAEARAAESAAGWDPTP